MKTETYLKLNLVSKLLISLFIIFVIWWVYIALLGSRDTTLNIWFSAAYAIIPFFAGANGLVIAKKWEKANKNNSRGVLLLSLGLLSWGIGEVIWSIQNIAKGVDVPYPSFSDAGYLLALPLWMFAMLFIARGIGLKLAFRNKLVKFLVILVPLILVGVGYSLILSETGGTGVVQDADYAKIFFDVMYPLWDVVILLGILIIDALAFGYVHKKLVIPLSFLSLGFIVNFLADMGFTSQTNLETFYNGNFVDLLYVTMLTCLGLGISTFTVEDEEATNIQSILLKQRDDELREVNLKLRERDQMLSRINQEIYKKNLELIEEKRKAEALLYNITEAVLVTDKDSKIVLFNRAAQSLLGISEQEAKSKTIQEAIFLFDVKNSPIDIADFRSKLGETGAGKISNLLLRRLDNKERYVNLSISKVSAESDVLFVNIISDVTEEIKTEKAREEFISIASHELRTPMTIVKNYLWMLQNKKGGALTQKQEEYIKKAIDGTERMLKLIHDMLDISRMEQGKLDLHPTQFSFVNMINEIASDFKIKADLKGIEMKLLLPENLPDVRADEDKLREVVINLVGNSFKFTDSGFVMIRVDSPDAQGMVKVSIMDTGKGIDKDDIPKLFNKFGRLDNSFVTVAESGGTGLGLYIVKSIVEAMGGTVGVQSEGVGKGSTFWFTVRTA